MGRLPTIGASDEVTFAFRGDLIAESMAPAVAKGGVLSQSWSLSRLTCEAGAFEIERRSGRTMYGRAESRQAEASRARLIALRIWIASALRLL